MVAALAISASVCNAQASATTPVETQTALRSSYGKLPLSFEANQGQTGEQARFLSHGDQYSLFLTRSEAVLVLDKKSAASPDVLRMELLGAGNSPELTGVDQLPGTANYFIGNDPKAWHTAVPTYAKVKYTGVYPGVNLVFYGNQRQLEYDFIVAPHADASAIRLGFKGAETLRLSDDGDLIIQAANGDIAFRKPVVYQEIDGRRVSVKGSYALLAGNKVSFRLAAYNHNRDLVIDPTLSYSTYLGGSGGDEGKAIAVDSSGSAYISGSTASTNFPTVSGAIQKTNKATTGEYNVFVTKLNPAGNALVYSTYLGGSTDDEGAGIAVDSSGEAYVTGLSESTDYPVTTGAFQTTNNAAGNDGPNAFITKLSAAGTSLVYSTFLGGNNFDFATAIALDPSENAYVTGFAGSTDFPVTTGAYNTTPSGECIFVTKINKTGASLVYSTFISGNSDDHSTSIGVSSNGIAVVAGWTESTAYPTTTSAFQKTNASGGITGFVTKLNTAGSALSFSTYLGGSTSGDKVLGLALDSSNNIYLTGVTASTDFPVKSGSFKTTSPSGSSSGFVTKMNGAGSALTYSTYLGGTDSSRDEANAIAVDSAGEAYVTGVAYSSNFPVAGSPFQSTNKALANFTSNAFLTKLNAGGSALVYSTYLGGSGNSSENGDEGNSIALDASGDAYLTGTAYSTNFPTKGPFQSSNKSPSTGTAFAAMFAFTTPTAATPVFSPAAGTYATAQSVKITDATSGATIYYTTDGTTPSTTSTKYTTPITVSVTETIKAIAVASGFNNSAVAAATYTIETAAATPVFSPVGGTYESVQSVKITDATSGATIYYTTNGTTPTTSSTKYTAAIPVSVTTTIKAIAVATGKTNSAVATATYTIIGSPTALASPATAIATPDATLNAIVNTQDLSGSYYFQYGTSSTALTTVTTKTALSASANNVAVNAKLTTLKTKTTYYFQVVVTTAGGSALGAVLSFTTN